MPQVVEPWAVFVQFKSEHHKTASKLEFLKEGETVEDLIYRMSSACNEFSGKHGFNVWVDDHHVIMQPLMNYKLS